MLAVIPFAGFYNTLHDAQLDQALEQMFTDRETGCERNEGLEMRAYGACNWAAVHREYAKYYAEAWLAEHGIAGEFESLQSPREYNFTTDRIFVKLADGEPERLLATVDRADLARVAAEMFTSWDGFISFYSPDVADWGDVATWDHNQMLCLLRAHADPDEDEFDVMEFASCNGYFEEWIGEWTPGIERLYAVHDYLEKRATR